jgi:IS605 OrfB family transposase
MKITRGYKTELDPTGKQTLLLTQCAGVSRFAYNYGLARKKEVYAQTGKQISAIDLMKELTARKQTDLPWLKNVSKWVYQNALRHVDEALGHFFRRLRERKAGKPHKQLGFPSFKKKSRGLGSFQLDAPIRVWASRIQLPKLGIIRLKERNYIPTAGVNILSATVSERAGRWYVSVLVVEDVEEPVPASGEPIGVDLGVKTLAVCSGTRPDIPNPQALRANLKRLSRLQRHLSRCQKGSANREKARKLVARQHARIANIREDALHQATASLTHAALTPSDRLQLTTFLAAQFPTPKTKAEAEKQKKQIKKLIHRTSEGNAPNRPQILVLEDLHVKGMMKNRKLSRAIADVGFAEFKRQIAYKSVWNGEGLFVADRFYPSTKRCSRCGQVKETMELSERTYRCHQEGCDLVMDRDKNAAENLADLARKFLAVNGELHRT